MRRSGIDAVERCNISARVERNSQFAVTRAITSPPLEKKGTLTTPAALALYQELEAVLAPRRALHRGP